MKLIIAGTHNEFLNCCDELGINPHRDAVYVSDYLSFMGFRVKAEDVIYYGTFYRRPDIDDIKREIQTVIAGEGK